jgi:hypothetical protein
MYVAIMINVLNNKRYGLGGGTRHLHQKYGDETGSTCVKNCAFIRMLYVKGKKNKWQEFNCPEHSSQG